MDLQEISINPNLVLRYVVPFYFTAERSDVSSLPETLGYNQLCQALSNHNAWDPEAPNDHQRDVYEYLCQSVYADEKDTDIGRSWRYRSKGRGIPLHYVTDGNIQNSYPFYISQMGLYIFRTNVGFLWFEIDLPKKTGKPIGAEEFILFQNRFKELYRTHSSCQLMKRTGKNQYEEFYTGLWIAQLLSDLSPNIRYLNAHRSSKTDAPVPDKALIFNLMLFEAGPQPHDWQTLCRLAYLLSNGFTDRYRMSQQALDSMEQPFEDVCWSSSKDGCGYYAFLNDGNRKYFDGNLATKVRDDYFFLYILALQQSHSLNNYLRRISTEFSADPAQYVTASTAADALDEFVAELNTFLMKSMYLSVSNIQHQNLFFAQLQRNLNIREDIESLNMGLNALVELQRIKTDKLAQERKEQEQERQDESDRQLNFSLSILSLFAVFSALLDSAELIQNLQSAWIRLQSGASFWSILAGDLTWSVIALVLYIVILYLSGFCLFTLIRTALHTRRKKK